ncbi:MAG TPA: hypothetical protein VGS96_07635 [Thermoanaerobaculia bacterium]|nr:hypothetical protein [Thermoanaerobaculia bacterium]
MVFRGILHELLATTAGAMAVIFLDFEGETVDLVCDRDLSDHDLRIIGAYHGIFLNRLRELCAKACIGNLHRFKMEFRSTTSLCVDLKEGYYIVLLLDDKGIEEKAWLKLEACKAAVLAEM